MARTELIHSAMKLAIFAIISVPWWYVSYRKSQTFIQWVGIRKIQGPKYEIIALSGLTVAGMLLLGILMFFSIDGWHDAAGLLPVSTEGRISNIPAMLISSILGTALPDELLCKGLLLKRFSVTMGFQAANIFQAFVCGYVHSLMFFRALGNTLAITVFAISAAAAWILGYINEKLAGGSILPGWMVHAAINILFSLCCIVSVS